jgi:FdhD protein
MKESWHAEKIEEAEEFWREERLDPATTFDTVKCIEISGSERRSLEADVAIEERIEIVIDGTTVADLFCLPSQLEELAFGHLICEGLVDGIDDIVSVRTEGEALICKSRGRKIKKDFHRIVSDLRMSPEAIFGALDQLNEGAHLWRRTGGTHSALVLREDGDVASFCEDVSRSLAVDKAAGAALLAGADLSRSTLITTGRLTSVIVSKAARAGFPIIVSRASPLNTGIELARSLGMTLAAFARRPNLYVYSGEERISYEK